MRNQAENPLKPGEKSCWIPLKPIEKSGWKLTQTMQKIGLKTTQTRWGIRQKSQSNHLRNKAEKTKTMREIGLKTRWKIRLKTHSNHVRSLAEIPVESRLKNGTETHRPREKDWKPTQCGFQMLMSAVAIYEGEGWRKCRKSLLKVSTNID